MPTATGSCYCENIKYKIEYSDDPSTHNICYCLECRKISGSTNSVNIIVSPENFHITASSSSKPKSYSKRHEWGMTLSNHFCGDCGTTLWEEGTHKQFQGLLIVQAGTLDGSVLGGLEFGTEMYVKHRVGWLTSMEGKGVEQIREFPKE